MKENNGKYGYAFWSEDHFLPFCVVVSPSLHCELQGQILHNVGEKEVLTMDTGFEMRAIGSVDTGNGFMIRVDEVFREGLRGLDEFSHVMVLWIFDQISWDQETLVIPSPYRKLTHEIGLFATRSPFRPNPIAVSVGRILSIDEKAGTILLDYIDAGHGSPVIDLKPYHPSEDFVTDTQIPEWCAHWPKNREESGEFDWESEFTFM